MNTTSDYSTPTEVKCFMAPAAGEPLRAGMIVRRGITADDVVIDIKYAGICHSDIHEVRIYCKTIMSTVLNSLYSFPYRLVMNGLMNGARVFFPWYQDMKLWVKWWLWVVM